MLLCFCLLKILSLIGRLNNNISIYNNNETNNINVIRNVLTILTNQKYTGGNSKSGGEPSEGGSG